MYIHLHQTSGEEACCLVGKIAELAFTSAAKGKLQLRND